MRLLLLPIILLFCLAFYLISLHLFQSDMMFHTDIARDFLLIEEIVNTKDVTLIGPKTGGIPGMFFGPVWLYAHVPLFVLGGGDPIIIAYFWVLLVLASILSVYYVTLKIFNNFSALVASLIYAFSSISFSSGFTQSFGSVLLAPWLVYCMYLFFQKKKVIFLLSALLLNGFVYQLQPAVGMLTLPVTGLLALFIILQEKKYTYLLSFLVLLIPFSTYILFDLRHDFLQLRSFVGHFTAEKLPEDDSRLALGDYIRNRTDSYFNIIDIVQLGAITNALFLSMYGFVAYKLFKKEKFEGSRYYWLFFAYLIGFIIITNLYKGIIIDYYYWALLPLSIIAFAGLLTVLPKRLFVGLSVSVLVVVIVGGISYRYWWDTKFTDVDSSSWRLNKEVAEFIYHDTKSKFGYYVYSPDEFGHSVRYAIHYIQRKEANVGTLCRKEEITYLIYYPTPSYAKTNPVYWREKRVHISKKPISAKQIHDILVEKYLLTDEEIQQPSDPNIVCDLHFR